MPVHRPPRSENAAVQDLLLDGQNPRLALEGPPTQENLLLRLFEEESLDELVGSFVENGYFPEEPLVAVASDEGLVVVEGNRRLATLNLLLDERLRQEIGVSDWPSLTASQAHSLATVPILIYEDRRQVLPYLGFRHITGARKWGPFQKARFISRLVEEDYELDQIQELVGDDTQIVKKLYQEYVVYRQITQDLGLPGGPIRDRFSLLEVTLGQRPIKAFLNLPFRLPSAPVDRLVPEAQEDELIEVIGWVFGSDEVAPVIADSREIPQLAKIIGDEEALRELRRTGDLEGAAEMLQGEQQSLLRRLSRAERSARSAAGLMPLYLSDTEVHSAVNRLYTVVASIHHMLPSEPDD